MRTGDMLNQLWENQAHVIRAFLEIRLRYEKLSEEVAYILERHVQAADIEYAAVTFRAKTLGSFCEKLTRKRYSEPLKEITDIAGVRIIFLYLSDRPELETLIEEEFNVIAKVDKVDKEAPDRFGYGALHYLVKLGKKASGARYDDLKNLVCEIQVRTILQDAWAVVAHHLSYKQELDVPRELRRKLNALSGLFETADDQFDRLRDERLGYKDKVKKQMARRAPDFLKSDVNLDNLMEYLNWRLSDRTVATKEDAADLLAVITAHGYTNLAQLDEAISRSYDAVGAYEAKYPPTDPETDKKTIYAQVGVVRVALSLVDEKYLSSRSRSKEMENRVREFRYLVKK